MIIKSKLLPSIVDDANIFGFKLKLNYAAQKSCAILREGALSSSHPV